MEAIVKQTAFKFDANLILSMKKRAKSLGKTVNGYVRDLIARDIAEADMLPKITFEDIRDDDVERLSGIFKNPEMNMIENDPRAKAIWER